MDEKELAYRRWKFERMFWGFGFYADAILMIWLWLNEFRIWTWAILICTILSLYAHADRVLKLEEIMECKSQFKHAPDKVRGLDEGKKGQARADQGSKCIEEGDELPES